MDGLELITWLKRDYMHVPVIAVSAYENTLNNAVALGADAVLKKPFPAQQLLHLARTALDNRIH
jgi:CheY-like chemotaxis protein